MIPKGWFKFKNGIRVYMTHSGFGHYPGRKGRQIINEIRKVKPKYLLIETSFSRAKEIILFPENYEREIKTSEKKRSDVGWAIIAGHRIKSELIGFDMPEEMFLGNIYRSFANYSRRLAILNVIAQIVCSQIWHKLSKKEGIYFSQIYKEVKKRLMKIAPIEVKKVIKKEGVEKMFGEWLRLLGLTTNDIKKLDTNYLSSLMHFFIRFPSRKKRDEYMIETIRQFAKKGKTAVAVGSGHIDTWIRNGWIKK